LLRLGAETERKDVQVGEVEEREEQDQSCVQIAVPCNAGNSIKFKNKNN
jgi:hypothetical protein